MHEVVLGIQFNEIEGYHQIYARDVWALYQRDFPNIEDKPALPPSFELFGLPQAPKLQLGITTGASHDRYWFVTDDGHELIQFQHDRLLHNWRRIDGGIYPRFEQMRGRFLRESRKLEKYFRTSFDSGLSVNQCEITYINHIAHSQGDRAPRPSEWLRAIDAEEGDESFRYAFTNVIRDKQGKPQGRLTCESRTAFENRTRRKVIQLTFSVRGAPENPSLSSAFAFLSNGRSIIVKKFAEITTDSAHRFWERLK